MDIETIPRDEAVTFALQAKLPDDTTLAEFAALTHCVDELLFAAKICNMPDGYLRGKWLVRGPRDQDVLIRAKYGSDYLIVLSVATGLAGVLTTLSLAVRRLSEAAKNGAEAELLRAQAAKTRAEAALIDEQTAAAEAVRRRDEVKRARRAMRKLGDEAQRAIAAEELEAAGLGNAARLLRSNPRSLSRHEPRFQRLIMHALSHLALYNPTMQITDEGSSTRLPG